MVAKIGELVVRRTGFFELPDHPYESLLIERADPRITIDADLLEEIKRNPAHNVELEGDVLRIRAVNQTVIYRIGEKVPDMDAYYAEWPD